MNISAIASKLNGNGGIVPPWLQHPVTPLPGPNDDFFILPIEQAKAGVEALA
jgi:hypothetical protein